MASMTILDELPDEFRDRVTLSEGKLFIARSLRGEPFMLSFLSLAERRGINENDIVWEEDRALGRRVKTNVELSSDSAMLGYAKRLLQDAYDLRASDIHLVDTGPQLIIQLRRMNLIRDHATLPGDTGRALLRVLFNTMGQDGKGEFTPHSRLDARIVNRKYLPADVYSVRVHTEPIAAVDADNGMGTYMALRLLYDSIIVEGSITDRLKMLGYPAREAAKIRFLTQRTGMFLIAGAMGSGKSTVLKHIMEGQAQEYPEKNYLTHEDPPEYPMRNVKQVIIGDDRSDANKGLLRTDLNVLMQGEIRDAETAKAALDETLAGHSVLGTIHALDAFEIVTRLRNMLMSAEGNIGDPLDTLCNYKVLTGLIYQRLLPTLCEHCKISLTEYLSRQDKAERAHVLPADVEKRLMSVVRDLSHVHVRGPGCEHCRNLGFSGRTLAVEVVVTDERLLSLIKEGRQEEARKYWKESLGGRSYVDHAIDGISAGILDPAMTERELGAPLNIDKAIESLNEIGD